MKKLILMLIMFLVSYNITSNNIDPKNKDFSIDEAYMLFIFNFTKYIENPVKTGTYNITIIGNNKLYTLMKGKFEGFKTSSGQIIKVVEHNKIDNIPESRILFISSIKKSNVESVIINIKNTLIITDMSKTKGSCINFILIDNKLKFQISKRTCLEQNLKVSSQLSSMGISID